MYPMPSIQTLLVAGDSHTWGQGSGGEHALAPFAAGELRPLPFQYPSYVNLLRDQINILTGSFAEDYQGESLAAFAKQSRNGESTLLTADNPLIADTHALLYRVCFQGQPEKSRAAIYINGRLYAEIDLVMPPSSYMYRFFPIWCDSEQDQLEIRSAAGSVLVYRLEAYRGPFAVINAGIGSCPLSRYLSAEIWENWITPWRPSAVIIEGNTINDWLTRESPSEYQQLLRQEIRQVRQLGAQPFLHTVSPILGPQSEPHNSFPYSEFIKAARNAALEESVPCADANQSMQQMLSGLSEEECASALFSDPWHPNVQGHTAYAKIIFDLFRTHFFNH